MPKRSNHFQRLIHCIISQSEEIGATVRESVELTERGLGIKREVDILIEREVGGVMKRLAIECRGRGRVETIEWIDSLIGKYSKLDVDKVIAVSNSKFSKDAALKAAAHNIELRSLKDSINTDWAIEFLKLGVAEISIKQISAKEFKIETVPALPEPFQFSDVVVWKSGIEEGTFKEFAKVIFDNIFVPKLLNYMRRNFGQIFKTLGDFEKVLAAEDSYPLSDVVLIDKGGTRYEIRSITIFAETIFTAERSEVEERYFEKAKITSAVIDFDKSIDLRLSAVQIAGKEKGKILITPEKKKKAEKV